MKVETEKNGYVKHVKLENERVRPCPFCGDEEAQIKNTHTAAYWMECPNCGATVSGEEFNGDTDKEHLDSAESALKIWNSRVK